MNNYRVVGSADFANPERGTIKEFWVEENPETGELLESLTKEEAQKWCDKLTAAYFANTVYDQLSVTTFSVCKMGPCRNWSRK